MSIQDKKKLLDMSAEDIAMALVSGGVFASLGKAAGVYKPSQGQKKSLAKSVWEGGIFGAASLLLHKFQNYLQVKNPYIEIIVDGDSMFGILPDGSKVLVKKLPSGENYQIGDVIAFFNEDGNIFIHKIVGAYLQLDGKWYYLTQGENNDNMDGFHVPQENIIGKAELNKRVWVKRITHGKSMPRARAYGMAKKTGTYILNRNPLLLVI